MCYNGAAATDPSDAAVFACVLCGLSVGGCKRDVPIPAMLRRPPLREAARPHVSTVRVVTLLRDRQSHGEVANMVLLHPHHQQVLVSLQCMAKGMRRRRRRRRIESCFNLPCWEFYFPSCHRSVSDCVRDVVVGKESIRGIRGVDVEDAAATVATRVHFILRPAFQSAQTTDNYD